MHATIRRYEGVDQSRTDELIKKVDETLLPRLTKSDGFRGYFVMEANNGVMNSISFFDTREQSAEASRLVSGWVRDEKLETTLPNPPKVTDGKLIVTKAIEKELVHA